MEKIKLTRVNDGKQFEVDPGTTIGAIAPPLVKDPKTGKEFPVLVAFVDHKLEALSYPVYYPHEVEFIGYNHADGRRAVFRSLSFLAQRAARTLFPDKIFKINHSLPSGYYCKLRAEKISDEDIMRLREEMRRLVALDLPFTEKKMLSTEAEALFEAQHQPLKAGVLRSVGRFFSTVYYLDGVADTFYGPLVPSTGYLKVFDLMPFHHGFCLQYPSREDITKVVPRQKQMKLTVTLKEYGYWCKTTGIVSTGALNRRLVDGGAVELINLCEAHQERAYADLADKIYAERERVKIVFLAGPSSSGKTSSSLRVAQQLKVLGMNPKVIELDNYFVERERTPLDDDGNYDFEALEAMDLELLGQHLNTLLSGGEVELPRYDFKLGKPFFEGKMMRLEENDILVMEGIHALDPNMVPSVDQNRIFRIYASALTSLKLDENCCISTTDNRLLRRMVRDNRVRGISPEDTILRWPSVRRGEEKYIFPFQENADSQFNTALLYELPMLRYYAEPLLRRIQPSSPAYAEAVRLLEFLEYIVALQPSEIAAIPPTSIMREFIGGQTL
ncbi:MAG: nucleoside kinase [Bacteroidales bacterium]|jgi:uridine kinase|nr:nucleoside kinase [Bacteroidales bacterium]